MSKLTLSVSMTCLAASLFICRMGFAEEQPNLTGDKVEQYLGLYKAACNEFPLTTDGLEALARKPPGKCPKWGPRPYVNFIPKDPWGRDWSYASDGKTFALKTLGKDGVPGGIGPDSDFTYDKVGPAKKSK